jgi:hypothetical protein
MGIAIGPMTFSVTTFSIMALFATLGVSIECYYAELWNCSLKRICCVLLWWMSWPQYNIYSCQRLLGVHSKLTCLVIIRKLSAYLMELAYRRPVAIVIFNTKKLNRCAMLRRSFSKLAHSILFTIKLLLNTNDPFLSKEVLLCDFLLFL